MAVTSTDTCDARPARSSVFFEPCDHCVSQDFDRSRPYVTPGTADAGDAHRATSSLFPQGSLRRRALCAWAQRRRALLRFDRRRLLAAGQPRRPQRALSPARSTISAVVLVNGDAEDDANGPGAGVPWALPHEPRPGHRPGRGPQAGRRDGHRCPTSTAARGAHPEQRRRRSASSCELTNGTAIDTSQAAADPAERAGRPAIRN